MEHNKKVSGLSSKELLSRLQHVNWEKIIKQLHYYSINKLKRYPQLAQRFNLVNLSTFFADEAIRQLWMGERSWDIVKYPELYEFLKGAVDSIRSNFLKSKEVVTTSHIDEIIEGSARSGDADPESKLTAKELEETVKTFFADDPDAYQVFDCLKNEMPPRDISTELNIPVKQVYNITKRIERKLTELRKQLSR